MGATTIFAPFSACKVCPVVSVSRLTPYCLTSSHQFVNFPLGSSPKGVRLRKRECGQQIVRAVDEGEEFNRSPLWDDGKRLEKLPSGKKAYLDERNLLAFLESPNDLIPENAAHLWNQIASIPEERRHRLLYLLNRWLVRAAWEVAGARYDNPELAERKSSSLLSGEDDAVSIEYWNCRKTGGTMPFALVKSFKKALFRKDGKVYGRLIGGSLLGRVAITFKPLYFTVKDIKRIVPLPTNELCDLAYDFGDGLLDLDDYPEGFPKPAKHPWHFKDQVVVYVRHVGPGVMIGQAWQEGLALEQVPEKMCNEILMVKDYRRV